MCFQIYYHDQVNIFIIFNTIMLGELWRLLFPRLLCVVQSNGTMLDLFETIFIVGFDGVAPNLLVMLDAVKTKYLHGC